MPLPRALGNTYCSMRPETTPPSAGETTPSTIQAGAGWFRARLKSNRSPMEMAKWNATAARPHTTPTASVTAKTRWVSVGAKRSSARRARRRSVRSPPSSLARRFIEGPVAYAFDSERRIRSSEKIVASPPIELRASTSQDPGARSRYGPRQCVPKDAGVEGKQHPQAPPDGHSGARGAAAPDGGGVAAPAAERGGNAVGRGDRRAAGDAHPARRSGVVSVG